MNWLDNVSKYYITKFIIKKKLKLLRIHKENMNIHLRQ